MTLESRDGQSVRPREYRPYCWYVVDMHMMPAMGVLCHEIVGDVAMARGKVNRNKCSVNKALAIRGHAGQVGTFYELGCDMLRA